MRVLQGCTHVALPERIAGGYVVGVGILSGLSLSVYF